MRTPHAILGIHPGASSHEVKAAWRLVARATHPDRNPGPDAARRFIEARSAYEWLISNPTQYTPRSTTALAPLMIGGPTVRRKTPVDWERYLAAQLEAELQYGWLGDWDRTGQLRGGGLPRRRRKRRCR